MMRWISAWRRRRRAVWAGLYLAALAVVLWQALGPALMQGLGLWQEKALSLADFTAVDVETVDSQTVETTSDDAQLHLAVAGAHSLWVQCTFSQPPGEFVLFYQQNAAAGFDARKQLYARRYGDWYMFPLPPGTCKLRLDLGVFPSVRVHFTGIVLNRRTGPTLPTESLIWALLLPGLFYTVVDWLTELLAAAGPALRRRKTKGAPAMTVQKDTVIADILKNDPAQGTVAIFLAAGMHCLGCLAAHGETVEQACAVHGVDTDALLGQLNAYFAGR